MGGRIQKIALSGTTFLQDGIGCGVGAAEAITRGLSVVSGDATRAEALVVYEISP